MNLFDVLDLSFLTAPKCYKHKAYVIKNPIKDVYEMSSCPPNQTFQTNLASVENFLKSKAVLYFDQRWGVRST